MHHFVQYNLGATIGRSAVATLGAPLCSVIRRMRNIGCGACNGRKHENWFNTYVIMKICEKASGVSWWLELLGRSLKYSWSPSERLLKVPAALWETFNIIP